ncbi:hypothetical protein [Phyllobacterium myrsinacearum]|uniref:Uncharacterized protein n=1 Tax=Phyllobacterium myrsinacearum TaxID=28101 RepID=A0A839EVG2_9HYPH|nr:hypothetical protein [Phyllobacterium myrsinacearum]MBA8881504.1 hypothetical protein [Phyllobacterium myrsinacearum]
MITRKVLATSPVAVECAITDLGRTLQVPSGTVYEWAINHLRLVEKAQENYDARTNACAGILANNSAGQLMFFTGRVALTRNGLKGINPRAIQLLSRSQTL